MGKDMEKNSESPIRKFFAAAEKIELAIGGFCLATLFVVVLIGIVSRLLNMNAAWYEETTRVFFLWMMWVGVGAGFNHSESSRVTFVVNKFPEFGQKICHVLYYPKAEPPAGGAPARRLKAAATGEGGAARPPLPSFFPLGQGTHQV